MKTRTFLPVIAVLFAAFTLAIQPSAHAQVSAKKRPLVTLVIDYNLGPGNDSPVYTLPANKSVSVVGNCRTSGVEGVASATILQVTAADGTPNFLTWVGLESALRPPAGTSSITSGLSAANGAHILYLDYENQVEILVNSANSIIIYNGAGGQRSGTVTLSYAK